VAGPRIIAIVGLFFVSITVLLQLAFVAQKWLSRGDSPVGWHYVWMLPITEGLLFALVGLALLPLTIAPPWRRGLPLGVPAFFFAGLAAITALIVLNVFQTKANGLLALGIAVRTAQVAAARQGGFVRFARRGAVLLGGLVCLLAIGTPSWRAFSEWRALSSLPAASEGAPNVLLLILDTVRGASLSAYGYGKPTSPVMQRVAEKGVTFDRAISTSSWTLPSHAAILNGRYMSDLKVGWRTPVEAPGPWLAEALRATGYRTGAFVGNVVYADAAHGLGRGFMRYEDYVPSLGEFALTSSIGSYISVRRNRFPMWRENYTLPNRKTAGEVTSAMLHWLDATAKTDRRQPFFAFLNFMDAHVPYDPRPPFDKQFVTGERWKTYSITRNSAGWQGEVKGRALQTEQEAYDGAIAYIDHEIGALLEELERRGQLSNTIVVISADHGEEFDEHGVVTHALSLYLPSIHVPLIIAGPRGIPQGTRVPEPVTLRDLSATLLDLVGHAAGTMPGQSLASYWRPTPNDGERTSSPVLSELRPLPKAEKGTPIAQGEIQSLVVENRYHYLRYGNGKEEVYDIVADEWEKNDLVKTPTGQAIADRYRKLFPVLKRTDPGPRDTL
jgi:arylsulfatase A-like enzyme